MQASHRSAAILAASAMLLLASPVLAQEAVRLAESIRPGNQYHVSSRVRLTGKLSIPIAPDQPAQLVTMQGDSTIDYDERILAPDESATERSLRIYRKIDFRRTTGDKTQQVSLRPEARRLIVVRKDNLEVPFSPDGPLTWGELDLIRTDVYTPALTTMFPARAVRPGDTWAISPESIKELTDLETIDQGAVDMTFEQFTMLSGRRFAQLRLKGSVNGVNEDGPNRQTLEGTVYFDLESMHLSYLYIDGVSELLDKDGKQVGRIEGKFTLTRQAGVRPDELREASIARLEVSPNANNTLLLHDDPDLGVRFHYPRNWRVIGTRGRQITVDESRGSGLLLTVEPPEKLPAAQQFMNESRDVLTKYNAKLSRFISPERIIANPYTIDHFAFDADVGGVQSVLDYLVIRQPLAGATIAARLVPEGRVPLSQDVLIIGKSLRLNRTPDLQPKQ